MKTQIPLILPKPSVSADRYINLCGGHGVGASAWSTSANQARAPQRRAGNYVRMMVFVPAFTGAGTWTFSLLVNGIATSPSLEIAITGATPAFTAAVDVTVPVLSTDDVCLLSHPTGTVDCTGDIRVTLIFEGTTAGRGVLFASVAPAGAVATFVGLGGFASTEDAVERTMPTSGEIYRMNVRQGIAPGTGAWCRYVVKKNGVATGLDVTISDLAQLGTPIDLVTPVTWTIHDRVVIEKTVSTGVAPASSTANIGLDWAPTIDGESIVLTAGASSVSNTTARALSLNGRSDNGEATDSNTSNLIALACALRKVTARLGVAPGAAGSGKSRAFRARIGGSTNLNGLATVSNDNLTATDAVSDDPLVSGDLVNYLTTPTGTPANTSVRVSAVLYTAPPAVAGGSKNLLLMGVG